MSRVADRVLDTVAGQLAGPHGIPGKLVAKVMNRSNAGTMAAAVDAAEITPGATAADIGFGGGAGLTLLLDRVGPEGIVYGIDPATDMLARARGHFTDDRLRLLAGTLTELPLPDASLDAAITVNTLYFVPDPVPAAAELVRVLRPGGTVVIAIGDPDTMAKIPLAAHGFTLRTPGEITEVLEGAGLQVEHREMLGRLPAKRMMIHLLIARAGS